MEKLKTEVDEGLEKLRTEVDQLLEEEWKIRNLRQAKEEKIRLILTSNYGE